MKVISIRQPWASLIVNGYKNYEFRSWRTKFRGRVLIHASGSIENEYLKRFESLGLDYPTSAIIGSVEITDCVSVTPELENDLIKKNEMVYGATRGRGGYGFKIENAVKFDKVIPANGNLSFWDFYTPEDVLELMKNIKYGWIDDEGVFYDRLKSCNASKYKLSKPKDIIKKGVGVCWDQVELERYYLRNNKSDIKTMFIYYDDGIDDESHTFLTYSNNSKYYWLECAWKEFAGIHEYDTINDLVSDVKNKFAKEISKVNSVEERWHCYIYDKPKKELDVSEFYEHAKSGEEIKL